MSDVKDILNANSIALQNMVRRTKTIRQNYAESTTGTVDTSFNFDDEVVDSAAYRRAFRVFTSKDKRNSRSAGKPLTEHETIAESGSDTLIPIDDLALETKKADVNRTVSHTATPVAPQGVTRSIPTRPLDPERQRQLHKGVESGSMKISKVHLGQGGGNRTRGRDQWLPATTCCCI